MAAAAGLALLAMGLPAAQADQWHHGNNNGWHGNDGWHDGGPRRGFYGPALVVRPGYYYAPPPAYYAPPPAYYGPPPAYYAPPPVYYAPPPPPVYYAPSPLLQFQFRL
jgi:hypothetical protein